MELTYPEVGGTLAATMPTGYHLLDRRVPVGTGREAFDRVVEAVLTWQVQRGAGLGVVGEGRVRAGSDVLLTVGRRPLQQRAPCRVVRVLTEDRRRGFAYGTLTGHPEQGEELFLVELDDAGRVWFSIRAFSRPASRAARLGAPVARAVQLWITRRYLASARRAASGRQAR